MTTIDYDLLVFCLNPSDIIRDAVRETLGGDQGHPVP